MINPRSTIKLIQLPRENSARYNAVAIESGTATDSATTSTNNVEQIIGRMPPSVPNFSGPVVRNLKFNPDTPWMTTSATSQTKKPLTIMATSQKNEAKIDSIGFFDEGNCPYISWPSIQIDAARFQANKTRRPIPTKPVLKKIVRSDEAQPRTPFPVQYWRSK